MKHVSILHRLPRLRGKYIENAELSAMSWLRVGGPAQVLFLPADEADLARFLAETPRDIPVHVVGALSNTLVRDGGLAGVTVKLTSAFGKIEILPDANLVAGAAALDKRVAKAAAKAGIAGLEFLVGVPGTIGGGLIMNAGCYGCEIADILKQAAAIDRQGRRVIISAEDFSYAYRHSEVDPSWIFTEAVFCGHFAPTDEILNRMAEIAEKREKSQPIREKTSGSTFKNPKPKNTSPQSAWELIDKAGWRDQPVGGARFSKLHSNFLVNDGTATALDIETLGERARADVKKKFGIELDWEVRRIGIRKSS